MPIQEFEVSWKSRIEDVEQRWRKVVLDFLELDTTAGDWYYLVDLARNRISDIHKLTNMLSQKPTMYKMVNGMRSYRIVLATEGLLEVVKQVAREENCTEKIDALKTVLTTLLNCGQYMPLEPRYIVSAVESDVDLPKIVRQIQEHAEPFHAAYDGEYSYVEDAFMATIEYIGYCAEHGEDMENTVTSVLSKDLRLALVYYDFTRPFVYTQHPEIVETYETIYEDISIGENDPCVY